MLDKLDAMRVHFDRYGYRNADRRRFDLGPRAVPVMQPMGLRHGDPGAKNHLRAARSYVDSIAVGATWNEM